MNYKSLLHNSFELLFSSLIGFSMIYALTTSMNFSFGFAGVFATALAMTVFFSVILYNRISRIITAVVLVLTSVSAAAYFIREKDAFIDIVKEFNLFAVWIIDYLNFAASPTPRYELYLTLILTFAVTLPVFVYARNQLTNPGDYLSSGQFILHAAPFCALIVAISFIIPAKPKPIEWKWLDTKINNLYHRITNGDIYVSEYFSVSSTGFGENSILGGKVRLDKTQVLKVDSPERVYLKGSVRDIYTGSSWVNSSTGYDLFSEEVNGLNYDTFELVYGLKLMGKGEGIIKELLKEKAIDITFLNLKTRSLFTPSKPTRMSIISSKAMSKIQVDNHGILVMDKPETKDFSYTVKSVNFNYGNKDLVKLLGSAKKGLYEGTLESFKFHGIKQSNNAGRYIILFDEDQNPINIYENDINSLYEHSLEVYSRYLQLPESLPARIKSLAENIVSGINSDYEKAKAIEQYLSTNHPYTLKPRAMAKDRDFVDFFLFDVKEGYCTYYASAMTVMLRTIGIPARYVEGYLMPSKPESGTTYQVTNENAHAWVEVYFEGFGWLPFEPTSPFRSTFYNSSEYSGNISSGFEDDPYYREYMRRLRDFENSGVYIPTDAMEYETADGKRLFNLIILSAVSLIILAFGFILLCNIIRSRLRLLKIWRMQPRESILAYYKHAFQLLSLAGQSIMPGETPLQYSQRIDNYMIFRTHSFKGITEIFMLARYSTRELNERQQRTVLDFHELLIDEIKHETGKFKFFFLKYILGKI